MSNYPEARKFTYHHSSNLLIRYNNEQVKCGKISEQNGSTLY